MRPCTDTQNCLITSWAPGTPIPYPAAGTAARLENYGEMLPEGLESSDVELIWWTAAATNSLYILQSMIARLIGRQTDWGDFRYHPIADKRGNGRYPQPLVLLVVKLLPEGVALIVDDDECYSNGEPLAVQDSIIIQTSIWCHITIGLMSLCPRQNLPEHLLEMALEVDLGL